MEMPFASLSVDSQQLAFGRKIEAEHDKVIKYLLLTANPDLAEAEVNRLVVLARDLIAKTHLSEFGNYYLPYLRDAEIAMKEALKPSGKKEESLTQEVNDLKAMLAEASDEGPGPFVSEQLFNQIQLFSRVTILTQNGSKLTGRATLRNDKAGIWVLNLGGPYGTTGIASSKNVVAVKGGLKEDKQFSPNKWSGK
jgi:hypothetical protein